MEEENLHGIAQVVLADREQLRQRQVFDSICDLMRELQYPPSRREIGVREGIRSPNTIEYHLRVLQRKGLIKLGSGHGRAIRVSPCCFSNLEGRTAPMQRDCTAGWARR
jgi:SOS-response transcriptional repressor LexA